MSDLLSLYDRALPQVYGYVAARVDDRQLAEDVTADTFLTAARTLDRDDTVELSVGWLVTVARNKLVDHWRRQAREDRRAHLLRDDEADEVEPAVEVEEAFDRARAHEVLARLGPHHRAALTLRYLDGLSVPEVATELGRTVHATEALLVRARNAFRAHYPEGRCGGD